jgi:uncharacterized protein YdhG (YjbR/CyaY superfamily)
MKKPDPLAGAVDAYVARQPAGSRPTLQRLRRIIRKVLPRAEETISYQIPTYKVHGRVVVYFAGWKQHWSLYPVTSAVRAALKTDLESYEISTGTIRFPLNEPVPTRLIERIVRELARAAEVRRMAKAGKSGRSGQKSKSAGRSSRRP